MSTAAVLVVVTTSKTFAAQTSPARLKVASRIPKLSRFCVRVYPDPGPDLVVLMGIVPMPQKLHLVGPQVANLTGSTGETLNVAEMVPFI